MIVVKQVEEQNLELGRYFAVEMTHGKHSAIVSLNPSCVHVIVQNAAHKVWRGMGKFYPTVERAKECYKSEAIKAMIDHAVAMSKAPAGTVH